MKTFNSTIKFKPLSFPANSFMKANLHKLNGIWKLTDLIEFNTQQGLSRSMQDGGLDKYIPFSLSSIEF